MSENLVMKTVETVYVLRMSENTYVQKVSRKGLLTVTSDINDAKVFINLDTVQAVADSQGGRVSVVPLEVVSQYYTV